MSIKHKKEFKKRKRTPGIWKGKVKIKKDFDVLPKYFLNYFR